MHCVNAFCRLRSCYMHCWATPAALEVMWAVRRMFQPTRAIPPMQNTPGFRYQTVIHHCSLCDHPINDGSERLFTGSYDSPKGECRCDAC